MATKEEKQKEKQTYLRTEIQEAGENVSEFVDYLSNLRENGDDIDNWSMKNTLT